MPALVPPLRCYKVKPFNVTVFLLRDKRVATIVDGGFHHTGNCSMQDLCFTTLYLFTCYIRIDILTIFTVASY